MLKLMTTNNNHVNNDNASPGEYTYALARLKLQHVQRPKTSETEEVYKIKNGL